MSVLQTGLAKSLAEDYTIDQSLRFEDASAYPYLKLAASGTTTSEKTGTLSFWLKRSKLGDYQSIFWAGPDTSNYTALYFHSNDSLVGYGAIAASATIMTANDTLLRDVSAWYHIVWVLDTTESVEVDRSRLYVNNELVSPNVSYNYPAEDEIIQAFRTGSIMDIARLEDNTSQSISGYLAEFHYIDGQALAPSNFAETSDTTNQWIPIEYEGTYGNNGFYQKYAATELADSFSDSSMTGRSVNCDILVVGGGGSGGGAYYAGGGGAGGFVYYSQKSIDGDSDHTVTIGAGGAAKSLYSGNDGSNSSFGSLTAAVGGGGGGSGEAGRTGGSGGGGGQPDYAGGSATANQGFAGGTGGGDSETLMGGGGGASEVGEDGLDNSGGDGGDGYTEGTSTVYDWTLANGTTATFDINGTGNAYAGGGGGATGSQNDPQSSGGAGGGGAGGKYVGAVAAVAGTANTGGGGGGGSHASNASGTGAAGGSGVVIVRYDSSLGTGTGGTVTSYTDGGTTYAVHTFTASGTFSMSGHTITANGDVANTRAQKKVGDSSIAFDGTGDYLKTTNLPLGDDFTMEGWVYPTDDSGNNSVFSNHWGDAESILVTYSHATHGANKFGVFFAGGSSIITGSGSHATDAWYHVTVERSGTTITLYVDGSSEGTSTQSTELTNTDFIVGAVYTTGTETWTGYMDEIRVSDVARYEGTFTPSTTEFTADANTKLLIHSDWDGGLGADSSGNYNTFTPTNLVATDQMVDSPTNNFCTMNPLDASSDWTISEGNTKCSKTSAGHALWRSTIGVDSGKWYWEVLCTAVGGAAPYIGCQQSDDAANGWAVWLGNTSSDFSWSNLGYTYDGGVGTSGNFTTYTAGDILGFAVDCDGATLKCYKNNVLAGTLSNLIANKIVIPAGSAYSSTPVQAVNFGSDSSFAGAKTAQGNQDGNSIGDFYYEPPTDYLALCTSNLDDPEIALPADNFNTVTYAGDGTEDRGVTGVGFQPDFTWIKEYEEPTYRPAHVLMDSVRGAASIMFTNTTEGEKTHPDAWTTLWGWFDSFDSDGFSVSDGDNNGNFNASPDRTYESWNWLAGGSGVANTTGTIDSTVSANTTAGFSIITYTGVYPQDPATIGHGLSSAPELVIVKRRNTDGGWWIVGSNEMTSWDYYMGLNDTGAQASGGYFDTTAPTASVIRLRDDNDATVNGNGNTYVAYAFHSVEGYSKTGSFLGNNATDGSFLYLGFRPAYVLIKAITATSDWSITDNKINTYNALTGWLEANTDDDLNTDGYLDFVSNGIKFRNNNAAFNAAQTYLYIAFAESPFKYANAR